jgi:hypothetical protein
MILVKSELTKASLLERKAMIDRNHESPISRNRLF